MLCQGKTAGAGDDRMQCMFTDLLICFTEQMGQCLLDIGVVTLIVGKQKVLRFIQNGDFYGGGTDVDSKIVCFFRS